MKDARLFDGDRVIVDRVVESHDSSVVVAWWDGGFTMKFLDLPHKDEDYIELRPANDEYPVFKVDNPAEFSVWGVQLFTWLEHLRRFNNTFYEKELVIS